MIVGILAGLTTGALWGLTFVAPRAVAPFTALDLTIVRYAIFGLASLALMATDARFRPEWGRLTPHLLCTGLALGGLGYVAYFVSAAYAVQLAGPAIPPLVIGALPVVLGIVGNWRDRELPWRALAIPLVLIAGGLLMVNVASWSDSPDETGRRAVLLGTLCALAALAIWIVYAIVNANATRRVDAPDALAWTGLQGVGAALGVVPLIPLSSWADGASFLPPLTSAESARFAAWALVLGIAGSWLATWCWVVAFRRLSLALAAQLIVAESVFGLLYGFVYEARWPTLAEAAGGTLQVAGVIAAIRLFEQRGLPAPQSP